ncbi:MAG: DegQ family serine endoprotease [Succinivibrio sp.]
MLKTIKQVSVLVALSVAAVSSSQAIAASSMVDTMAATGQIPSLAPMLKTVLPSVVNISVKGKKDVQGFQLPEEFRFMFPGMGDAFGNGAPKKREFRALGSGVIIDAGEGLVVSNNHVVADADKIRVQLSDGREFDAKLVGSDPHTDLALLKLEKFKDLTAIEIADSDTIEVGDFAVAIGNPYGLGQTVTSGIVSALGRTGLNIENIENFIQTDAAINSGNSGGALVNLRGQLIGINTAIMAPSGGNIGIGFAIPSNMVKTVTNQLLKFGSVKRGMLGVTGSELNADLADSFGYDQNSGAFVNQVLKDSAADKAGIKSGDIITAVNGKKVSSFAQLRAEIATQRAGSEVTVTIFRDGKEKDIKVKLGDSTDTASVSAESSKDISPAFSGAALSNAKDGGVEVTDVAKGSPAARFGLRKGDIITAVNRNEIKNLNELKKSLEKVSGKISAIKIQRDGGTLYITLR